MKDTRQTTNDRRTLLKLLGGSAVLLPLAGLAGCAKKEAAPAPEPTASPAEPAAPTPESAPAATSAPAPEPTPAAAPQSAPAAGSPAAGSPAASNSLPHLDENDPTAKALGYRQDSSKVDASKFPRHAAGQACQKCAQFRGAAGDAWGGCNIFAGKQVNANGWCSAFAAKA